MKIKKYILLVVECILFLLYMDIVMARVATFSGSLRLYDATPSVNNIYVFQFGSPYFDRAGGVNWKMLGETKSNADGSFSLNVEIGSNTEVAFVVPHAYPRYSLIEKVNIGILINVGNINLKLPNNLNKNLSFQARIFENNTEIDYMNRIYKVVLVPVNFIKQGIWAELTDATYPSSKLEAYDLSGGIYRVICLLASKELNGGEQALTKEIVLPLSDTQVDFYF